MIKNKMFLSIIISFEYMFWPFRCLFRWQHIADVDVEKNNDETHTKNSCVGDVHYSSTHPTNPTKTNPVTTAAANHHKSVFVRTFHKPVVVFISAFIIGLVIVSVWYFLGWMYGLQAIVVAVLAVLAATGGWYYIGHWLYIAAVTAPRDVRYIFYAIKLYMTNMQKISRILKYLGPKYIVRYHVYNNIVILRLANENKSE